MYQLEETLAMYESGIQGQVGAAASVCWEANVSASRRAVDDCHDVACRQAALLERISSLHDLQPPSRHLSIDLPKATVLVAVLGPEMTAASKAASGAAPAAFAAQGQLVHALDDIDHMGLAVRTESGQEHVFIPDMDLGSQPGHAQLQALVGASPTPRVLVRGTSAVAPDGVPNFDVTQCRMVYQVP